MTSVERIRAKKLPSRVAGRRQPNLVGTIEGTIVATAVVAGLSESNSISAGRALWVLVATGGFFWVAHVYADLLAGRIQGQHRMGHDDVVAVMSREWPLCQSTFALAVPLALGALGVLSRDVALNVATLVGVMALVAWGVVFARREGLGIAGIVGAASMNATVGLIIIGFKVAFGER
jgi:hypothetical protein